MRFYGSARRGTRRSASAATRWRPIVGFSDRPAYPTRRRWPVSVGEGTSSGEVDRVVLVYNARLSPRPAVTVQDVLPISADILEGARTSAATRAAVDFFFEPEPREILARLLPVYVETELYRALLESAASEQGARMTAMRNASKKAGELIDRLTCDEPRPTGRDHPGDPRGGRRADALT